MEWSGRASPIGVWLIGWLVAVAVAVAGPWRFPRGGSGFQCSKRGLLLVIAERVKSLDSRFEDER